MRAGEDVPLRFIQSTLGAAGAIASSNASSMRRSALRTSAERARAPRKHVPPIRLFLQLVSGDAPLPLALVVAHAHRPSAAPVSLLRIGEEDPCINGALVSQEN